MKFISTFTLISFFFIFTSCEKQELLAPDISAEEFTVIQCELSPNTPLAGVRVTKTLPLGVKYDIKIAEIKNAALYLKIDYVKIIPLHYTSDGLYKPLYEIFPHEGEYFELFGELDGKTFYSKTKIPFVPQIISTTYNLSDNYAEATEKNESDEVYSAVWAVNSNLMETGKEYFNIVAATEGSYLQSITVRTSEFPEEYQTPYYQGRKYIQVFSFDKSFENYCKSKGTNNLDNNPYVQGTGETVWNIQGVKVIGMFIGVAKSNYIFVD